MKNPFFAAASMSIGESFCSDDGLETHFYEK